MMTKMALDTGFLTTCHEIVRGEANQRCDNLGVTVLTKTEFEGIPEYSCTLPTGTTIGKKWKRREPYVKLPDTRVTWYIGEYYDIGLERHSFSFSPAAALVSADFVGIRWTRPCIVG
jgi:hypothetical protein